MGSLLRARSNKWDRSERDVEIKTVICVCVRPLFLPVPFWVGEIWAEYSACVSPYAVIWAGAMVVIEKGMGRENVLRREGLKGDFRRIKVTFGERNLQVQDSTS